MLPVLSPEQIKKADEYTINHEPVSSADLMERAAKACFDWIREHVEQPAAFSVFCGPGNNGGDGMALARLLNLAGYPVNVFALAVGQASEDFLLNKSRLQHIGVSIAEIGDTGSIPPVIQGEIIIDALFGVGLNKPAGGLAAEVINRINLYAQRVISIDMPSGLFADRASTNSHAIIKAQVTLTFQQLKLALLFPENERYTGEVTVLPIGLDQSFIGSLDSKFHLIQQQDIHNLLKKRSPFSHKGNYGHALIIAGSAGKTGASILCAKACLRSGAGLVSALIPAGNYNAFQASVPEAMVITDKNETMITGEIDLQTYDAVAIGPGIGTDGKTAKAFELILKTAKKPVVIDADGLNILSKKKKLFKLIPENSILTPHPKEFERLFGKSANEFERNDLQSEMSRKHKLYILLKGKYSCVTDPGGNRYFNPTGNPGMAKGGTGDALAGMITAFLAQHYSPKEACLAGVYLHGLAADMAVRETGEYSLLTSDLIDHLGKAFLETMH